MPSEMIEEVSEDPPLFESKYPTLDLTDLSLDISICKSARNSNCSVIVEDFDEAEDQEDSNSCCFDRTIATSLTHADPDWFLRSPEEEEQRPAVVCVPFWDVAEGKSVLSKALLDKHIRRNDTIRFTRVERPIRYSYLRTPGGQKLVSQQESDFNRLVNEVVLHAAPQLSGLGVLIDEKVVRGECVARSIVDICAKSAVDRVVLLEKSHPAGVRGKIASIVESLSSCPVVLYRQDESGTLI